MALKSLHTNWILGSYQQDRDDMIKESENNPLRLGTSLSGLRPLRDGANSIAIGYGFDLLVRNNTEINTYLTAVGLGSISTADASLLNEARARRTAGTATHAYLDGVAAQLVLDLGSEANATKLLDEYITKKAEKDVETFLLNHGLSMSQSRERAALVSLAYNSPALLGGGLASALNDGNRGEAWYQIRYQSNGNALAGLANRRYRESALFGLYDNETNPPKEEAVQIYQMYTKHLLINGVRHD